MAIKFTAIAASGEIIHKASAVKWGTHLLRWRYFDVTHNGITYHRNSLISTALWHLLKRIYVDREWPRGTSIEDIDDDARITVQHPTTEIIVYGDYRTNPPRLQWGFLNPTTNIAVVYDMEAACITTVFKPVEGILFFERQIDAHKIDRKGWSV